MNCRGLGATHAGEAPEQSSALLCMRSASCYEVPYLLRAEKTAQLCYMGRRKTHAGRVDLPDSQPRTHLLPYGENLVSRQGRVDDADAAVDVWLAAALRNVKVVRSWTEKLR